MGEEHFVQHCGSFQKDWKGISFSILGEHSLREGYRSPFLVGIETSTFLCLSLDLFVRKDLKGIKGNLI